MKSFRKLGPTVLSVWLSCMRGKRNPFEILMATAASTDDGMAQCLADASPKPARMLYTMCMLYVYSNGEPTTRSLIS